MERPRCLGVARDAVGLTGTDATIGGAPAYVAKSAGGPNETVGVLVIHDIWGWRIPNAKYIADHLGANGFSAILPNLYHEISSLDGWPGSEFDDGEALEGAKWEAWWTEITAEAYWKAFHERVGHAVKYLKEEKVAPSSASSASAGEARNRAASSKGIFAEAASVYGCHENAENFAAKAKDATSPTVPGDESFPEDAQKKLLAGAPVTVYDGHEHGFAVRGDFKVALKQAADVPQGGRRAILRERRCYGAVDDRGARFDERTRRQALVEYPLGAACGPRAGANRVEMVDVRSLDMLYGACREGNNTHSARSPGGCGSRPGVAAYSGSFVTRRDRGAHRCGELRLNCGSGR